MAEMLERHPNEPVIWREMAMVMQEDSKWKELLGFSFKLRNLFPNLAFGYRIGAVAHLNDGDIGTAEELAFRAILRFPQNPDCYFTYAECAEKRGELKEAMARRRTIIGLFPESKWASHGLMSTMLSLGESGQAESVYIAAILRFANDRDILNIGARVAEANRDYIQAATRWDALLELDSHNRAAHDGSIRNWTEAGRIDLAHKAIEHRDYLIGRRQS